VGRRKGNRAAEGAVVFSPEAFDDLIAIRSYIRRDNPDAASRVAVQIIAACDGLEHLPERGRPGLVPGTRELTLIWPYVIVYRVVMPDVEIVRVWHGAQDRRI
jgi:addiction module RelE/StbE family toxin